MLKADIDSDVFNSEVFQLREEFSYSGEVVSNERLTTIIYDTLSI